MSLNVTMSDSVHLLWPLLAGPLPPLVCTILDIKMKGELCDADDSIGLESHSLVLGRPWLFTQAIGDVMLGPK